MAPRIATVLSTSLVPLSLSLAASILQASVRAAGDEASITKFCLASFNAAMAHAGKTPLPAWGPTPAIAFLTRSTKARPSKGPKHLQSQGSIPIQNLRFIRLAEFVGSELPSKPKPFTWGCSFGEASASAFGSDRLAPPASAHQLQHQGLPFRTTTSLITHVQRSPQE